jgi:DNA-binding XRE family transcriptional regulator
LRKQLLSAASLKRDIVPETSLGDAYASRLLTNAQRMRRFGPLWHLVSGGATHDEERVRMIERSRSILLPGLAAHRRKCGLTQRQLGELAGVAHTTVQKLESLSRGAYPRTVRKLAAALGVGPEDLVGSEPR